MRDRTAMTEPLTVGQQIVAKWESLESGWSEPADLADGIDAALKAEREACAEWARTIIANGVTVLSADEVYQAICNRCE